MLLGRSDFKSFKMTRVTLLLSICVALINARCPGPRGLPRLYNSNTFMCARLYEHTHHVDNLSCSGIYRNVFAGENTDWAGDDWNDKVSALVVSEGCRLDVYMHKYYEGGHRQFEGKVYNLLSFNWNDVISSWSCACDFTNDALRCTPSEEYILIASCGNPDPGTAVCTHGLRKGLSIGSSYTHGKSLSASVKLSLQLVFKQIFTVGLDASITTDFSWSQTDSSTFSELRSFTISCGVPVGSTVKILQVVGRCGDTVVYTSHYICQHAN